MVLGTEGKTLKTPVNWKEPKAPKTLARHIGTARWP